MNRFRTLGASTLLLGSLLFAVPVLAAPQAYEIDPVHSRVEFTIRHMFSKVTGDFGAFKGIVKYDPAAPATSSVTVEIDASSIDTNNDGRDKHLKSSDFFDVAKYPTLQFVSTKITPGAEGKLTVEGMLTMHGVTKPVVIDAAFLGAGPDLRGTIRAGFEGSTKVDRKDYGIVWNKTLDQGGTYLGDDVTINLQIEGVVAKEESAKSGK